MGLQGGFPAKTGGVPAPLWWYMEVSIDNRQMEYRRDGGNLGRMLVKQGKICYTFGINRNFNLE